MIEFRTASSVLSDIEPELHRAGYLVALYGSVLLKGAGRDVDILLVPWRPTDPERAWAILGQWGSPLEDVYRGLMGTQARPYRIAGMCFDVQIREDAPRPSLPAVSAAP